MTVVCPICHSTEVMKRGTKPKQRYQCMNPKHMGGHRYFYNETSLARVLVLDIETLPGWKRFWRLGEEDWNIDSVVYDWMLLSYSAKWLFEPAMMSSILTPKEVWNRDDKRLAKELWKLFHEADIIIAHNGDNFDIPKVVGRFLEYGYVPPAPFQTIDTKKESARMFGETSNKLDWLARKLGLPTKLPTDYSLWLKCEAGEQEALDYMLAYNEQDIFTLEDVYIHMRPWIKHPNMSLFVVTDPDTFLCPHCGSDDLDWSEGMVHRTQARAYQAFRCNNCGAIGRPRESHYSTSSTRVRT